MICAGLAVIVAGVSPTGFSGAVRRRRSRLELSLIWSLIVVVSISPRLLSFIALFARGEMPPLLARALRHVPAAMLTAIVVPAIVFVAPGVLTLDAGDVKLIAALVAGVVAWRWRNTLLTIAVGRAMAAAMAYQ